MMTGLWWQAERRLRPLNFVVPTDSAGNDCGLPWQEWPSAGDVTLNGRVWRCTAAKAYQFGL